MFEKGTENYKLPQWAPTDHPDFLNDMNPAYRTIDKNLGEVVAESSNNSQKIVAMEVLQNAQGESITQLQTTQNSQTLDIATLKHDMNDAQSNIAKNAGDIQILTADNHEIHEDIAGHLSDYNVLLKWAKYYTFKVINTTAALGGKTIATKFNLFGHNILMSAEITTDTAVTIPAKGNVQAIINPGTFDAYPGISFANYHYDYAGIHTYIRMLSNGNYAIELNNVTEAPITVRHPINSLLFYNTDEFNSIETALNHLRAGKVTDSNITYLPKPPITGNGGESDVAETAGTSEDNANDNG